MSRKPNDPADRRRWRQDALRSGRCADCMKPAHRVLSRVYTRCRSHLRSAAEREQARRDAMKGAND